MIFLKLAPIAQSWDFWVAIFFCVIASFIWLFLAWKSTKSGTIEKKSTGYNNGYEWVDSKEHIKIYQSGYFAFFCLHFVLGQVFFWAMLWPDFHDVWFIK
ncbi:MAG: hypothetical protein WC810_14575 [Janthinobacterium sp.]|jgi:hypothetical protein